MSTTTTIPPAASSKLELRTAYGPVFRDVLNTPPRDCTPEEIPIIDLAPLYSVQIETRKALAKEIRAAAVNTGFFYIKNHGIEPKTISDAKKQLLAFFKQPSKDRMKISQDLSKYFNGYRGPRSTKISPGESLDVKESVGDHPRTGGRSADPMQRWDGDTLLSMTQIQKILMQYPTKSSLGSEERNSFGKAHPTCQALRTKSWGTGRLA